MAPLKSLSLWWIWLAVTVLCSADSQDQKIITATSGQDATLTCRAPNNNIIIVVEWIRADLGKEYVFMYRGGYFVPDDQHSSFKNRVDLRDRQMKDGDVSLILNNVTINDTGTYQCHVFTVKTQRKRENHSVVPISIIYLHVVPPGQTGGHTEDGGKEAGGKKGGSVGLKAGLPVAVFLLVVVVGAFVGCWIFRKDKPQTQESHLPPAEPQIEMSKRFLKSESPAAEYNNRTELKANNCHEQSTRVPDVTLTLENELLHPPPQETAGLLPERNIRVQ